MNRHGMIALLVTALVSGYAFGMWQGQRIGKKQGYAICVSEEDDDSVRVRRF